MGSTWMSVFWQLAAALPGEAPSIVVIDELPWPVEADPMLEGTLQTAWDTVLAGKPVLLVLIGSDLAMMERLDDYRRPFHQRGTVMVLPPLSPAEVGAMLSLPAAEAIDAYLVTGGLPPQKPALAHRRTDETGSAPRHAVAVRRASPR